ncbi:GNAT family N-acetyltransferase [Allopusillimonas ginsengisoli]|uniref:GNAT family N-acetyltransferase n=1 Tax=Allopusillimonas ginsengisoli TaxID=453575 RepID=UPI0039C4359D
MSFEVTVEHIPPQAYLHLAWDTFFVKKDRGLTLESHFPWICNNDTNVWYVMLWEEGRLIGGLSVKTFAFDGPALSIVVAAVGLVCIHEAYRGQGLSNLLLKRLVQEAKCRGIDALTLWTQISALYQDHGFRLADDWMYGWVELDTGPEQKGNVDVVKTALPADVGIPPFATSGRIYTSDSSSLTIVCDAEGEIVVACQGPDFEVINLMRSTLPQRWRINLRKSDSLYPRLEAVAKHMQLAEANLQLWRTCNTALQLQNLPQVASFKVLQRI